MHFILLGIQLLCALVGLFCLKELKNSYWKWFPVYLTFIFLQDIFWTLRPAEMRDFSEEYYAFFGIPIQYLFFFWLYAYKSLNNEKLFYTFALIYLLTYIPTEFYFEKINLVYSINLTVGTILLAFLIVMEFKKQIKNDNILEFQKNKMFYVNIGVILFYVGTYPFFAFEELLSKEPYVAVWNGYYLFFLLSNYSMYLLFTASFIWGKHPLK